MTQLNLHTDGDTMAAPLPEPIPKWQQWVFSLVMAALVSWGVSQAQLARVEEREGNHYQELHRLIDYRAAELQRSLDLLRQEVRESRPATRPPR